MQNVYSTQQMYIGQNILRTKTTILSIISSWKQQLWRFCEIRQRYKFVKRRRKKKRNINFITSGFLISPRTTPNKISKSYDSSFFRAQ